MKRKRKATANLPKQIDPGNLTGRNWKRFIEGPDQSLLEDLYIPMLSEAIRYDRCCAYFSSTVLAAAARGFAKLIERILVMEQAAPRPAIRLIVNEEMNADDVKALVETGDTGKLEALLKKRFKNPKEALTKDRLAMLGWLVKNGYLELRVGLMRSGGGILHAKFGIATDEEGNAVVFSGSGNESGHGLIANYEQIDVSTSWEDAERHEEYTGRFDKLWTDTHPTVFTVSLPEALRKKLIKFAPPEAPVEEPSNALQRQKAGMIWRYIVEAPFFSDGGSTCDATALIDLWPHQGQVIKEVSEAWPDGRLLCDEVGMGKTIEAILVLRRLMAGRGVRRALLLLPASLTRQWQAELREKGGLIVPRLEGINRLVWPDGREQRVEGIWEALQRDLLIMSRETARTENNLHYLLQAEPWDLVLLDEAHAARRRQQEEGEYNSATLLLNLLRQIQLKRKARGIVLLSATPMQTHPWEPWDLLAVLGEGGAWLAEFSNVRDYYRAIAGLKNGVCSLETSRRAASLIIADPEFPLSDGQSGIPLDYQSIIQRLSFARTSERDELVSWLREGSPLVRRMHRNTRRSLLQYYKSGLLPSPPTRRKVMDYRFDFQDEAERKVYNDVGKYIEKRFEQLESEKPGKGFVMTIYRRRASSSPLALERSLKRRMEGLLRVAGKKAYENELNLRDQPEALDLTELPEGEYGSTISAALPTDPEQAKAEIEEVDRLLAALAALQQRDSKRDYFYDIFRQVTGDGRAVLVFTEYTDTMEYLRDCLVPHYGKKLGCYSGDGGQIRDGEQWKLTTKYVITRRLQEGSLNLLICTDAASEGLNLQAAGAIINYDLPWNPSKVEQRIGRIDRIGQQCPEIYVVNLFLRDSVDDRVYRALKQRCGLFEHFVGAMQPVLSRAQRMLRGNDEFDLNALNNEADSVEHDPVAEETYAESIAKPVPVAKPAFSLEDMVNALEYLDVSPDVKVKRDKKSGTLVLTGSVISRTVFAPRLSALEADDDAIPLSPFAERILQLAQRLSRPGERLPLVLESHQRGSFRRTVAYWVTGKKLEQVPTLENLENRLMNWDGKYPEPEDWNNAVRAARAEARKHVAWMEQQATEKECRARQRQIEAARLRLLKELGRFLVCYAGNTSDLNAVFYQLMTREALGAARVQQCYQRLGGVYPEWPEDLCDELDRFNKAITDNQRKARLLGKELDAALQDPRWEVQG